MMTGAMNVSGFPKLGGIIESPMLLLVRSVVLAFDERWVRLLPTLYTKTTLFCHNYNVYNKLQGYPSHILGCCLSYQGYTFEFLCNFHHQIYATVPPHRSSDTKLPL